MGVGKMGISTKIDSVHVVPSNGRWKVIRPNASRASSISNIKGTAIGKAKTIAKNDKTTVYVHRTDGKITSVVNFSRKNQNNIVSKSTKRVPITSRSAHFQSSNFGNISNSRKKK